MGDTGGRAKSTRNRANKKKEDKNKNPSEQWQKELRREKTRVNGGKKQLIKNAKQVIDTKEKRREMTTNKRTEKNRR